MSTKTSIKRIALVAVSGLGLGLLSVVPANAASSAPTASVIRQTTSVGVPSTAVVVGATGTPGANTATVAITAPAGSTVTTADRDGAYSVAAVAAGTAAADGTVITASVKTPGSPDSYALTFASAAAGTFASYQIVPDVPGLYTITVTAATTEVAYIWAWASAANGASLVGLLGDGGYPSDNSAFTGVAGPANTVQVGAFPSTTANVRRLVTVEGAGAYISAATPSGTGTVTLTAGTNPTSATLGSVLATDAQDLTTFTIATPSAGTVLVKLFSETAAGSGIFSSTAAAAVTITVNATGSSGSLSTTLSTVLGNVADAAADTTTNAAVPSSMMGTGAVAFKVRYDIKVRDVLGALRAASTTSLTAAVSGTGLINTTNTTAGAARVAAINWNGTLASLYLFNDGTAGASTVTFYWGSTVLATKTMTFTGAPKTLEATAWEPHVTVGTVAEAIEIVAKDANGNITEYTPTASTSNAAIISPVLTCNRAGAALVPLGYVQGAYYCDVTSVSVGTADLTIAPGSLTTNSPKVTLRVTKNVAASVALKTNKDSYAPGEKITLTLEAKDADGYLLGALPDQGAGQYYDLVGSSATTVALQGTAFSATNVYISAGTKSTTFYAPLVSGPVTFSVTLDATSANVAAAIKGTTVTKTITVGETAAEAAANAAADAAAEAIDAANAATDAANLAAEAADAATVAAEEARDAADAATAAVEELAQQVATLMAALKAQITTLANTVAKIAKKVRA